MQRESGEAPVCRRFHCHPEGERKRNHPMFERDDQDSLNSLLASLPESSRRLRVSAVALAVVSGITPMLKQLPTAKATWACLDCGALRAQFRPIDLFRHVAPFPLHDL